ncbi:MAG TPA: RNA-binding protein [Polyangiaceae bacterium LLY-WYZ-15_(1-7)]|nr:RNA-binding protein [Polyangiaceae bacterium LLY-WYZ-15_(1-7)]HJL09009.1 RNA-binding protein [Polyangiaceae bacterium LLY-WYZ-15_(1-7)]HJL39614.1 RNA-binding protein [Polyangiaceae bacterium LLY-WYZ-15_(1-7)]HJL46079.1 RNA-binding protein [Polyangiaceae bacterium LLY-WYZ-15_(1-7)]
MHELEALWTIERASEASHGAFDGVWARPVGAGPCRNRSERMSKKLFVGGLPWATGDLDLRDAFEPYGEVVDAKVITDRETGRSRGFGFVTFAEEGQASAALEAMDGAELGGRRLRVDVAQERQRGGGGGGRGGRGGGGGYGGGGRGRRDDW